VEASWKKFARLFFNMRILYLDFYGANILSVQLPTLTNASRAFIGSIPNESLMHGLHTVKWVVPAV
jgi:hypothetical protein